MGKRRWRGDCTDFNFKPYRPVPPPKKPTGLARSDPAASAECREAEAARLAEAEAKLAEDVAKLGIADNAGFEKQLDELDLGKLGWTDAEWRELHAEYDFGATLKEYERIFGKG